MNIAKQLTANKISNRQSESSKSLNHSISFDLIQRWRNLWMDKGKLSAKRWTNEHPFVSDRICCKQKITNLTWNQNKLGTIYDYNFYFCLCWTTAKTIYFILFFVEGGLLFPNSCQRHCVWHQIGETKRKTRRRNKTTHLNLEKETNPNQIRPLTLNQRSNM